MGFKNEFSFIANVIVSFKVVGWLGGQIKEKMKGQGFDCFFINQRP